MMPEPYLAPFPKDQSLLLSPAPNGGWVVRLYDQTYGAYGNAADMLRALERALLNPATEEG